MYCIHCEAVHSIQKVTKDNYSAQYETEGCYDMHAQPALKKVTHCTSGRGQPVLDYSQFELDNDPPSPAKKRRHVDLKRKASAARIAAEKLKTKPLNKP